MPYVDFQNYIEVLTKREAILSHENMRCAVTACVENSMYHVEIYLPYDDDIVNFTTRVIIETYEYYKWLHRNVGIHSNGEIIIPELSVRPMCIKFDNGSAIHIYYSTERPVFTDYNGQVVLRLYHAAITDTYIDPFDDYVDVRRVCDFADINNAVNINMQSQTTDTEDIQILGHVMYGIYPVHDLSVAKIKYPEEWEFETIDIFLSSFNINDKTIHNRG